MTAYVSDSPGPTNAAYAPVLPLLDRLGGLLAAIRTDRVRTSTGSTPKRSDQPDGDVLDLRDPVDGGDPAGGGDRTGADADLLRARTSWAIVERVQAGDAEAFGELYDRYAEQVFRYLYYRLGNREVAEDLTSDTFLRALRRIGSLSWQGRDVGAWLTTIARNLVADHYKSSRYKLEISTADMLDADRPDRHSETHPEEQTLSLLASEQLLRAVRRLGAEQQECIVLRFLQGLSVAETAEVLGKSSNAVKALQYRAVRSLAGLLPEGRSL